MNDRLGRKLMEMHREITLQREEILRAFIAKHGCEPDDCIQIVEPRLEGLGMTWRVERRPPR